MEKNINNIPGIYFGDVSIYPKIPQKLIFTPSSCHYTSYDAKDILITVDTDVKDWYIKKEVGDFYNVEKLTDDQFVIRVEENNDLTTKSRIGIIGFYINGNRYSYYQISQKSKYYFYIDTINPYVKDYREETVAITINTNIANWDAKIISGSDYASIAVKTANTIYVKINTNQTYDYRVIIVSFTLFNSEQVALFNIGQEGKDINKFFHITPNGTFDIETYHTYRDFTINQRGYDGWENHISIISEDRTCTFKHLIDDKYRIEFGKYTKFIDIISVVQFKDVNDEIIPDARLTFNTKVPAQIFNIIPEQREFVIGSNETRLEFDIIQKGYDGWYSEITSLNRTCRLIYSGHDNRYYLEFDEYTEFVDTETIVKFYDADSTEIASANTIRVVTEHAAKSSFECNFDVSNNGIIKGILTPLAGDVEVLQENIPLDIKVSYLDEHDEEQHIVLSATLYEDTSLIYPYIFVLDNNFSTINYRNIIVEGVNAVVETNSYIVNIIRTELNYFAIRPTTNTYVIHPSTGEQIQSIELNPEVHTELQAKEFTIYQKGFNDWRVNNSSSENILYGRRKDINTVLFTANKENTTVADRVTFVTISGDADSHIIELAIKQKTTGILALIFNPTVNNISSIGQSGTITIESSLTDDKINEYIDSEILYINPLISGNVNLRNKTYNFGPNPNPQYLHEFDVELMFNDINVFTQHVIQSARDNKLFVIAGIKEGATFIPLRVGVVNFNYQTPDIVYHIRGEGIEYAVEVPYDENKHLAVACHEGGPIYISHDDNEKGEEGNYRVNINFEPDGCIPMRDISYDADKTNITKLIIKKP